MVGISAEGAKRDLLDPRMRQRDPLKIVVSRKIDATQNIECHHAHPAREVKWVGGQTRKNSENHTCTKLGKDTEDERLCVSEPHLGTVSRQSMSPAPRCGPAG